MLYQVECKICHKREAREFAHAHGWDWFTGYNKKTTYYCANDAKTHEEQLRRDIEASRVPNDQAKGRD